MNKVQEYIYNILPRTKRRGDWYCFSCPSCMRFGEKRPDQKSRGGIRFDGDGIVYNCFNCKMTWGWTAGNHMSRKMKMFLEDMGLSPQQMMEVNSLIEEYLDTSVEKKEPAKLRIIRDIPDNYKSIKESLKNGECSKNFCKILNYINNRNPKLLEWEDLMWCDDQENFLIPCYEYGRIVGYSLRSLNDMSPSKYIHYTPSGYIYGLDNMQSNRKYNIIVEGELDALAIKGSALLSNTFTADKLKRVLEAKGNSEIILLPDKDNAGKKMVEQLLTENLPFSVSFPNWGDGVKDAFDAVKKYGRLYTIYMIIKNKETDKMKIKMKLGKWA